MTNENIFKHRGLNNLSSFALWKFAHIGKKKKKKIAHSVLRIISVLEQSLRAMLFFAGWILIF